MNWHTMSEQEVLKNLGTNPASGLSDAQAEKGLKTYGENKLEEKKRKGFLSKFFEQFNDFMIIILLVAAAISFGISILDGDADFVDPIIILSIVIVNAILGVVQENKAEKSLEALKQISAPTATVRRGGHTQTIPSSQVVPGDILVLKTGDLVAADCRLLSSVNLQTDESSLTGESLPVTKYADHCHDTSTPLAERDNMVLSSTSITAGRGEAIAVKTGMETEVGQIAGMILTSETSQTPLQKKLSDVGKVLGFAALFICAVIFVIGLLRSIPPFEMFMTSVSLAVAAIPEGLPAIVTIMLAIGVQRMVRRNAIVRSLPAVETLGSASVICSDKTGTLTQNKMTVTKLESHEESLTLTLAALCSDAALDKDISVGSPTEKAIIDAAYARGLNKTQLDKKFPRIGEIPFDSTRKRMTTLHRYHGTNRIITKGAPDILLELCTHYFDGNKIQPMTQSARRTFLEKNAQMASDALRVIAVAYRDTQETSTKNAEKNLVFAGLIGMIDPPRPEVFSAVAICKKAGIRPVMITGDHIITATAIAKQIGILSGTLKAMTGAELDTLSQEELNRVINNYAVFARVTPEHKVRIVKAFKARGEVVAMTGDGVNDAPALKAADIGCAMGQIGTDVAKGAADMILTDDNFATIVEAVRQGRGIFANIKKAIQFLLSSNIGEILTIFVGLLFGWSTPLVAIQLLWVNLVTDSFPAIALGLDPADRYIMNEKPRNPKKNLFADGFGATIILEGLMIGALALLAFSIGKNLFDLNPASPIIGRTMAFAVLSMSQLVHAFNMRSEHSVFSIGIFGNKYLVGALLAGVVLQVGVITIAPLAKLFRVSCLSPMQWLIVAVLAVLPLAIVELQKRFSSVRAK